MGINSVLTNYVFLKYNTIIILLKTHIHNSATQCDHPYPNTMHNAHPTSLFHHPTSPHIIIPSPKSPHITIPSPHTIPLTATPLPPYPITWLGWSMRATAWTPTVPLFPVPLTVLASTAWLPWSQYWKPSPTICPGELWGTDSGTTREQSHQANNITDIETLGSSGAQHSIWCIKLNFQCKIAFNVCVWATGCFYNTLTTMK